ncbi:molybdate ABC transporter permease subunit [Paenibacillus sp. GCM10027626]|uniref:molybdate ABC transporter permease subunit n=1 Tax=Paenibacillus sp. GCM10027626 TaxID=3273411 RepID=UPI00363E1F92
MCCALNWSLFAEPLLLSLKVSLIASTVSLALGIIISYWMVRHKFIGKIFLETTIMMPLVLPPTVVGFLLLVLLGRRSWIGKAFEWITGQPIIFSWAAAVIAAIVVTFPLVYQSIKTGFSNVSLEHEEAAWLDGANEWQVLFSITLPLAKPSLITAYILGFARALGEFGATLMVAGNIPGRTQTIPTAIYGAVESNEMVLTWLWTLVMIHISFVLLLLARAIK